MRSISAPTSISPETVSQIGAGALLLTVAVVELWLTFWAAGWWHRSGATLVAAIGIALIVRALGAVTRPLRAERAQRAAQQAPASRLREHVHVVLVEPSPR